jgi:hypothetical protein
MMAVRTKPEFIAFKPSHRFLLTPSLVIRTACQYMSVPAGESTLFTSK